MPGSLAAPPLHTQVAEIVREIFGKEPSRGVNPDEVVAMGAAIQGAGHLPPAAASAWLHARLGARMGLGCPDRMRVWGLAWGYGFFFAPRYVAPLPVCAACA
jgi:hypothetical protein